MNDRIQEIQNLRSVVDWAKQGGYIGFQIGIESAEQIISEYNQLQEENVRLRASKFFLEREHDRIEQVIKTACTYIEQEKYMSATDELEQALSHLKG